MGLTRRAIWRNHNKGLDPIAPFRIGHTDHRRIYHVGMAHQNLLDLTRVSIGPARYDNVLGTVSESEVSVFVKPSYLPGP